MMKHLATESRLLGHIEWKAVDGVIERGFELSHEFGTLGLQSLLYGSPLPRLQLVAV